MKASTIFKALAILLCCLVCAYTYAQNRPEYVPGQVLIKMKQDKTAAQKNAFKTQLNATKRRTLKNDLEVWQIEETNGTIDIKKLTERYRNHPDIEYVEPNYYYYLAEADYDAKCIEDAQNLTPNDPDYALQWGLHNTGQTGGINDADIDAPEGWDIATGSPSVKVAILDSGIDWGHEDLAENIWQNLGEDADGDGQVLVYSQGEWIFDPGDDNGIDDDGNGYIDDFIGWDFVHNDNDPRDTNGHGTHVAGILGARGDNNKGISGVTWDVQMMPIRIFGKFLNNSAPADSIISALNYAVSMGATISNNSWGGGQRSQAMEDAIRDAANVGHLFIAAAGNDGLNNDQHPYYPATYDSDNIISVAAIDQNDQLPSFSHYGATTVHIAAPGVAVWSSIPADAYEYRLGTSMATPHVSGAVALLWGLHYNRSYLEIKDAIINSAEDTPALQGKCVADGRLNLFNALDYFGPAPVSLCRASDSLALVALYDANPTSSLGWDLTQPINTWSGVIVNEEGCVSVLSLFYKSLDSIPAELGNLTNLISLGLSKNNLATLPPEIGNLLNLNTLDLRENELTTLPPDIGNLTNLSSLNLDFNFQLTTLPPEIWGLTNLSTLYLSGNNLTTLSSDIGNLTNLSTLYLSGNTTLPPEIWGLTNLSFLYLSSITTLPSDIGNLTNLSTLYLTGITTLPPEIWDLTNLSFLYLTGITTLSSDIGNLTNLSTLHLSGNTTLPPEIWDLTNLSSLTLHCELTTLPPDIGNLMNLSILSLTHNYLMTLPPEIGNLTNLSSLDLWSNNLTTLPPEIGNLTNLMYLDLYDNDLITLTPELGNLTNLRHLVFGSNSGTGCFDENLINLCDRLIGNHIDYTNNFDATWSEFCSNGAGACSIPTCSQTDSLNLVALYNSTDGANWANTWDLNQPMDTWYGVTLNGFGCVTELELSENNLNGIIPIEIGDLTSLISLDILKNGLIGDIPSTIGNLNNLTYLNLGVNQLTGSIPTTIGNLVNLTYLRLSTNDLTGIIPTTIGNLLNLTTLWLSGNEITGNIPLEIESLTKLTELRLNTNHLDGNIPVEIGNLTNLTDLHLSSNELTGSVPVEIGNLINLTKLRLNSNELTGSIPVEIGNLTNLTDLRLHNNQFNGSIPPELGSLSSLIDLRIYNNQLSDCYSLNLLNLCTQLDSTNTNNYISDGNNFDATWEDFCNTNAGVCESVYPGDFNFDGTASEEDVLYWGLAYGHTGPPRQEISTDWKGHRAEDWAQSVEGVNSKHQDGDGNGVVDDADLQVLDLNFGRIHTFNAPPVIASTIIYRLERNGTFSGNPAYDLYVEDGTGMPVDAHGVALTIDFGILPVLDIDMDISNSSLAPSDTLTIFNEPENRFHVALTRTDGSNQICDTPIASLIVIMEDIPSDTTEFEIRIENGNKIEADGTMKDIVGTSMFDTPPGNTPNQSGAFSATASALHTQCTTYGMAWVTASGGIEPYTYQWNTGETTDRITDLTSGIYEVTVTDSDGALEVIMITVEGQYLPIYDGNGNLIDCIDSNCPTLLTPGGLVPDGTYQADRTINSNGTLTGNTDYKAGETIILEKGFEIPPGTEFSGTIEVCPDN